MILKRHSIIFKIFLSLTLLASFALAAETIEQLEAVDGKVIGINEDYGFVIINLGQQDGIDIEDVLDLYQDNQRIGGVKVLKVRDNIAAAEITELRSGIIVAVGDRARFEGKPELILGKPYYQKSPKLKVGINADSKRVWFYLIQVLRDHGFMITNSNRASGLLTARKNLEFSLAREIWADIRGNTDYETVLQATVISQGETRTALIFKVSASYNRRGKPERFHIKPESKIYQEIGEIMKKVKEQAGR